MKLPNPRKKIRKASRGKAAKVEIVAEKAAHPDARSVTSAELLDLDARVPKAVALSLDSSTLPSPPLSHKESDLLTSTVSALKAYSDPSCSEGSSTTNVDQCYDNLLEMIRPQRQALLTGPRITIHIGNTSVANIYKRSAMAASSVLHRHFTNHPDSLEYRFSRGQIHPGAVRLLLIKWMREACNEFEAHAVPYQKTFFEDVAVLRAARLLGMERYCPHILGAYITYLKSELPSYEEIVIIEQNATSDKDPLWTTMVNHLCHERFKGLIPDADDFEEFLETHDRLKTAMETADAFFAGYAKRHANAGESERRQRRQQNEAEKRARIEREKRAVHSLKKKLGEAGSGLLTVTADEAEMLRGRTYTP